MTPWLIASPEIFAEPPGLAALLPEKYYFILLNPLPAPYELRAFCVCAIRESGTGCMRRPRRRAPRRSSGIRRAAGNRDDGGGDPDPAPNSEPRAAFSKRGRT